MKPLNDITRLRDEYEDRKHRLAESDLYSLFNRANLFIMQGRQREVLTALKKNGYSDLAEFSILEMGCGGGGVLTEYLGFGASPENLYGVDLLFDRLLHATITCQVQALPTPMDSPCRIHPKPSTWSCNTRRFPPSLTQKFAVISALTCCVSSSPGG